MSTPTNGSSIAVSRVALLYRNVLWSSRAVVSSMAALSLIVLVLQNSTLVLMTRYSRFFLPPSETYYTSTLVLNQEVVKMFMCIAIFVNETESTPERSVWAHLWEAVWQRDTLLLIIPAALFTLQNFLIFVALSHLDAMSFQVLSQTKLLSAALFSVWLLDRKLSKWQWFSLLLLTIGVYLSQSDGQKENFSKKGTTPVHTQTPFLGAAACIISGLSSSFAGVYFEKVVKTTPPSLAVRNIHLSIFGIPFSFLSLLLLDLIPSRFSGTPFRYWQGYGPLTICLVFVHALGGLLVAVVVKYADNILKGFATGVAIIVSGLFSAAFWGYTPNYYFVAGCVLVTFSSVLYHYTDIQREKISRHRRGESEEGLAD